MSEANICDCCGKVGTLARLPRQDAVGYEGWWHLESIESDSEGAPLHTLDICSQDCLGQIAKWETFGHVAGTKRRGA